MAEEGDYDTVCIDTGQNTAGDEDTEYNVLCRDKVQRTHTTTPAGGEESAYDNLRRDKPKNTVPAKAEKNAAAVSAGPDAVYSALTTRKENFYEFPPDNDADEGKDTYSMINLSNLSRGKNEEAQPPVAASIDISPKAKKVDKSKSGNILISILVAVMLVITVIIVACFAAVFVEIAKLKGNPAEMSTVADSSVDQLNHTFLNTSEQVLDIMNQIAMFNETISELMSRLNSEITTNQNLRNRLSNLNESITEQIAVNQNFTDKLSRLDYQGINNSARLDEASQGLVDLEQRVDAQNFVNFQEGCLRLNDTVASILSNLTDKCVLSTCYSSCADLPSCFPSGYYWVRASNGSDVRVYCDMTLSCGNITGGWMRVAELNMTDTSQQCPGGLEEKNDRHIRRCETMNGDCSSITHSIQNICYSKVCGRITAYQVGTTNAFRRYYENTGTTTINSTYVDGVSLTHGSQREHIWTLAAALDRGSGKDDNKNICPCQNDMAPPQFVGEDYFCDAGNEEFMTGETGLQTDPLWDGTDCLCCDNPPWFYKQLPQPTTDDIEMRVCTARDAPPGETENNENIGIQEIEIYVQ